MNTSWIMEEKKSWRYSSLIMHCCIQAKPNREMDVRLHLPLSQEKRSQNSEVIARTVVAAKVYNSLLHNRTRTEVKKILRKNHNSFRRNRSTSSLILSICRIIGISLVSIHLFFICFYFLFLKHITFSFLSWRFDAFCSLPVCSPLLTDPFLLYFH